MAVVNRIRGGVSSSTPFDLKPSQPASLPPARRPAGQITLGDLEDLRRYPSNSAPVWIETQRIETTSTFQLEERQPLSVFNVLQDYAKHLHELSPTLSIGSVSCMLVFVLWQIPLCRGVMGKHFVCNWRNLRDGRPQSVLLAAVSHASPVHLLLNLMTFLSLGPTLRRTLHYSTRWPLWPLVIGSAMVGSVFHLLKGDSAGCMGLSGVTLAFIALLAKLFPNSELGLGGMRLRASFVLSSLLVWSTLGSLWVGGGKTAHVAHLGGLLFGMAYYELWARRRQARSVADQLHKFFAKCITPKAKSG